MDLFSSSLDIFFLVLAVAMIPASHWLQLPERINLPPPSPCSPFSAVRSYHSTPSSTPIESTKHSAHLVVPHISVTPVRPKGHKRKSVSFSLSSAAELHGKVAAAGGNKRPHTPYVIGPSSPGKMEEEDEGSNAGDVSGPATPLLHSRHAVDPMGVEKNWLLP